MAHVIVLASDTLVQRLVKRELNKVYTNIEGMTSSIDQQREALKESEYEQQRLAEAAGIYETELYKSYPQTA